MTSTSACMGRIGVAWLDFEDWCKRIDSYLLVNTLGTRVCVCVWFHCLLAIPAEITHTHDIHLEQKAHGRNRDSDCGGQTEQNTKMTKMHRNESRNKHIFSAFLQWHILRKKNCHLLYFSIEQWPISNAHTYASTLECVFSFASCNTHTGWIGCVVSIILPCASSDDFLQRSSETKHFGKTLGIHVCEWVFFRQKMLYLLAVVVVSCAVDYCNGEQPAHLFTVA